MKVKVGTKGAEHARFLVPETQEQQRANGPLCGAEKNGCAANTQNRDRPGDKRAMGNDRQQPSDLRFEPFVVAEPREDDHHCGAEQVVIEVALQEAERPRS